MNEVLSRSIHGRELITLDGHGVMVSGTLHTASEPEPAPGSLRNSIGIVFLNSLSLPRTATGDSSVFWAETFANIGYPSLRLDLPGLGDSGGAVPAELLPFINSGGYTSIAAAKIKEVVERFGFSGVVLVGHCAGTVTAVYTAAACAKECKGLILLDPYFHLPQAVRPMVRRGLSAWALRSRFGAVISNVYDRIRSISRWLRTGALPRNANRNLLVCWSKLASTGLPILLFKAPARKATGTKPRAGEFDYLSHVLQLTGPGGRVQVELVEQTDHSFANRAGRSAVARSAERWLGTFVPTAKREEAVVTTRIPQASGIDNCDQYHLHCVRT